MYPVWDVPHLTAGMVLGLIAAFHMLPSHLSTGAMWLNLYLETKAYREERPELLDFVRRYSRFILIFAYVFGSLTGVAIWFSASAASPRGLSGLIHAYVWGWATEWVFFLIEVSGIFVYYYTLGKVDRRTHLTIGWIFALGSWTTMIVIVGILTFMMTPGAWPQTGRFFDGFFNPTYWPQLLFRTAAMFAIAAAWAVLVASRGGEPRAREAVVRTAGGWGLGATALAGAFFLWYRAALPEAPREVLGLVLTPALKLGMAVPAALLAAYFLAMALKPAAARFVPALLSIAVLFAGIFSFERVRELIRKPYVIPGYMYSNGLLSGALPESILKSAPFVPAHLREVTEANRRDAGRMVALIECAACHSLSPGGLRPLGRRLEAMGAADAESIAGFLDALDGVPYMPPFVGTQAEKEALAAYLAELARR